MCVEISNFNTATMEYKSSNNKADKKMSYSLKKVLKAIFKKHTSEKKISPRQHSSLESLESLENQRNAEVEMQSENEANERIYAASCSNSNASSNSCSSSVSSEDHYDEASIYVPVHFARTANGTFFWTASSSVAPDADLMEPLDCCTDNQIAVPQWCGDRWAQA